MNKQSGLFSNDYRFVYKNDSTTLTWSRITTPVRGRNGTDGYNYSWVYKFVKDNDTASFAFCYPYGYEEIQAKSTALVAAHTKYNCVSALPSSSPTSPSPNDGPAPVPNNNDSGASLKEKRAVPDSLHPPPHASRDQKDIYIYRECLVNSLEGRSVDILTISSFKGIVEDQRESLVEDPADIIFPNRKDKNYTGRAHVFEGKKIVFVSCRVHPGESPAQYVYDGFIDFIVKGNDPRADLLRDMFVFKCVPVINPDGVYRGHYRTDTLGMNLNRFYDSPDPLKQPTIYAIRSILMYYSSLDKLYFYLDMHAHVNKRGVFFYGNHLPNAEEQCENELYAHLVAVNTPYLEIDACCFSEKNMKSKDKRDGLSKEGSGRVALYQSTNIVHCYTLEANYNDCKRAHNIGPADTTDERASPPRTVCYSPKLTQDALRDTGKACAVALLDLNGANPWSRLPKSPYQSIHGARLAVMNVLREDPAYEEAARAAIKKLTSIIKGTRTAESGTTPPSSSSRPTTVPLSRKDISLEVFRGGSSSGANGNAGTSNSSPAPLNHSLSTSYANTFHSASQTGGVVGVAIAPGRSNSFSSISSIDSTEENKLPRISSTPPLSSSAYTAVPAVVSSFAPSSSLSKLTVTSMSRVAKERSSSRDVHPAFKTKIPRPNRKV